METEITVDRLILMKGSGEKIAALTAYDAGFARILDDAGVDVVLVGDSLGMVLQGSPDTLTVSMGDMVYHTRLASRGTRRALLVADMPYRSYDTPESALENAQRLVEEGRAAVVKLEGGREVIEAVRSVVRSGIAVCGHLGLQPQSIKVYGGYKVQGTDPESAERILADARLLQEEGVSLLVVECIPRELAARISTSVRIPVIGIGAGPGCDGQVLVLHDLLGISARIPRMAKDYLETRDSIRAAVTAYIRDVKEGRFPGPEHSFP